jgi:hypothetical protein
MAIARFNAQTVGVYLGLAMLAGCGGQRAVGGGGAVPAIESTSSETLRAATPPGDLLYVARVLGKPGHYRGAISVLTFPNGKPVATILTPGFTTGLCSDASGNVWAVVVQGHHWSAYEFSHGGTKPIAKIHIPHTNDAAGCTVDPTNGNLAVFVGSYQGSGQGAFVDVWAGAREGMPTMYQIAFTPFAGAYDDRGNLFVDGYIGDTVAFEFAELAKGASSFTNISLSQPYGFYPGGVQWDGKYVALAPGPTPHRPAIYRLKIAGSRAKVVDTVHLDHMDARALFSVKEGMVAAASGVGGYNVRLWRYPGGDKSTKTLLRTQLSVSGLAISAR